MAAYVELIMEQGANFSHTITLTDDLTNANVNLTNCVVTTTMKRYHQVENVTANLVCTVTNPTNGVISLTLPAANTGNIDDGRYVFATLVSNNFSGVVTRILEGVIFVTPG